jgi:branched-chain amino acid transport system ATP-binding protein
VLKIRKLVVHYGPLTALHEISLEIKKGEVVSLFGPNGAGKTTLLLTLSGVLKTSEGRITFQEEEIANLDPYKIVSVGIGHVPQGRHAFPTLSVLDNLLMGAYLHRNVKGEVKDELEKVYQLFPILEQRRKQRAGTLSGGEQQMLTIGRALMGKPKLLLLDEPSMGLGPHLKEEIFVLLKELNRRGLTLFIVEQEVFLTLGISHRGYFLRNGRLIKEGPASALIESKEIKEICLGTEGLGN